MSGESLTMGERETLLEAANEIDRYHRQSFAGWTGPLPLCRDLLLIAGADPGAWLAKRREGGPA